MKPNKSILRGTVRRIEPAADGFGANVTVAVEDCAAAEGKDDFLRARPGSDVTVFAAVPEDVEEGKAYALTTSVLGGPRGSRVVLERARALD